MCSGKHEVAGERGCPRPAGLKKGKAGTWMGAECDESWTSG